MCVNDLLGVAAWQHSSPTNLKERLTESGTSKAPFTWYNLLSNWLSNPFDNRVNVCIHNTTGCQPVERTVAVRSTRLSNRLSNQVVQPVWQPCWTNSQFVQHGCQTVFVKLVVQPGLTTGWTNSGCSFNTVVKPGCTTSLTTVLNEQSVSSTRLSNRLSNPFDNRFDNWLYVCLHDAASCQIGCTTGLTTGCIV